MTYKYYAENHDWDLTLRASETLLRTAEIFEEDNAIRFSTLTGSMLLAFCSVESFLNSVAFLMSRNASFAQFEFAKYRRARGIWDKISIVCAQCDISPKPTREPFKTFEGMRIWRNALVHANPYAIEDTTIEDPALVHDLHADFRCQEYAKLVSLENGRLFLKSSFEVIEKIRSASGINPQAMVSYERAE